MVSEDAKILQGAVLCETDNMGFMRCHDADIHPHFPLLFTPKLDIFLERHCVCLAATYCSLNDE